jgi:tyrosine ammonia-lyase
MDHTIELHPERSVRLRDAYDVATGRARLALTDACRDTLEAGREQLSRLVDERRRIYGVTTGYGPLATSYISPSKSAELQRKLVYHLATGVGDPLSVRATRALMTSRAINLSRGYSAVRVESLELLLACINRGLTPVVPSLGTVGASGDLTPLAHMTLALMGEGDFFVDGRRIAGEVALREAGLEPLDLADKEGLAFVNGTSAMTGLAVVNAAEAEQAIWTALRLSLLNAEVFGGRREAWDPLLGQIRPHAGQQRVHRALMSWSESSERLEPIPERPKRLELDGSRAVAADRELPQDPYTIRCVPQLYGALLDALEWHNDTAQTELNSVTDNPVFSVEDGRVVHGGNFYGQHIAFASDTLSNALIKTAVHAERVIARVTDASRNGGLPAFLQGNQTGLNSGFMGAQVTASSLIAQMRTKSNPASIQSIPTNADNQDVVTMGTIGALRASQLIDRVFDVLAVESLVLVQAMELEGGLESTEFSVSSRELATFVRERSPFLDQDRPLSGEIQSMATALRDEYTPLYSPSDHGVGG